MNNRKEPLSTLAESVNRIVALLGRKDYGKALDEINKLTSNFSNQAILLNLKGAALLELGRHEDSQDALTNAIKIDSNLTDAYCNLGILFKRQGKTKEAIQQYLYAIQSDVKSFNAHLNLGNLYKEQNKNDLAIKSYLTALAQKPDAVGALVNLGVVQYRIGMIDDAEMNYRKALELNPKLGKIHNNLGIILGEKGNFAEAIESYRAAIAIDTTLTEVHRHLAGAKKFKPGDPDLSCMIETYKNCELSADQRMHLDFALGKAHEDLQEYEMAFEYFEKANRYRRRSSSFSLEKQIRLFSQLKYVFNSDLFLNLRNSGIQDKAPIFIIGMPRSGTTLVEQIISSHSAVKGAGELTELPQVTLSHFTSIADKNLLEVLENSEIQKFSNAGTKYIETVKNAYGCEVYFTDKLPLNFLYVGFIKLILPAAKVVHVQRDPLDTCWSIYKNLFTQSGNEFAYQLDELGAYYKLYKDLMDHWHRVIPGFVYDLQYEELIENQDGETRNLLEFCELEWEESCFEFYRNKREVKTASVSQVREPINSNSIHLWKNYAQWLGPLIGQIEDQNIPGTAQ